MSLEWTTCPESDNIFAEIATLERYWICFNGSRFELERVVIDRAGGKWTKHGDYQTIPAAKCAATKMENAKCSTSKQETASH